MYDYVKQERVINIQCSLGIFSWKYYDGAQNTSITENTTFRPTYYWLCDGRYVKYVL